MVFFITFYLILANLNSFMCSKIINNYLKKTTDISYCSLHCCYYCYHNM